VVGIPGFGVVAWQANLGFKNLVEGQTHRAEIELQAREHSYRLDQQKVAAERTYQHRVLAASLHGELIALLSAVHQQQTILRAQNVVWKRLSLDRDYKNADAPFTPPRFAVPIYQANIDRLGLLGPSVAANVVQVYAPAATPPPPAAKLMPGLVYTAKKVFSWHSGIGRARSCTSEAV